MDELHLTTTADRCSNGALHGFQTSTPGCPAGYMAAPLCPDAGPVLDRASDLPADHAGPVRQRPSYTAQQDQVGV